MVSLASVNGTSLELSAVTISDGGKYVCSAVNSAGTVKAETYVIVLALPIFVEKPTYIVMKVGGNKKLPCSIEGKPNPLILWRLRGANLDSFSTQGEVDGKFQVEEEDTGTYT